MPGVHQHRTPWGRGASTGRLAAVKKGDAMNTRQRRSLVKFFQSTSTNIFAIVVIANAIKNDIPVMRSVSYLLLSAAFAVISLYLARKLE